MPVALQQLAVDLKPVSEQDHDQSDGREVGQESRPDVETKHTRSADAEREPGQHEQRHERKHAAAGEAGEESADHQQPAEHADRGLE